MISITSLKKLINIFEIKIKSSLQYDIPLHSENCDRGKPILRQKIY
jgi:hypothetical protein